jgi:hypothetical protein
MAQDSWRREGNLAGYVDRLLLPGKVFQWYFPGILDPKAFRSYLPGGVGLLGVLTGQFLISDNKI